MESTGSRYGTVNEMTSHMAMTTGAGFWATINVLLLTDNGSPSTAYCP
jgi:hypothetical protein